MRRSFSIQAGEYRLWNVSPNMIDDGGKDDIVVEINRAG